MDRLPSLKGLQFFAVVAKYLSFTRAADELNVTQAAVSQQIRNLEQQLGVELFRRTTRRLFLTDNGERLLPYVQDAFSVLAEGVEKVKHDQYDYLNISVLPSFAARWLVPRLGSFSRQHPDIEVRLLPSLDLVNFQKESIDLAIRFGEGQYPGVYTEKLMNELVFPVCSPELMEGSKALRTLDDLVHHPVLQDAGPGRLTWREWLKVAGRPELKVHYGVQISDASLLLDAAKSGQGVALGRACLVESELDNGSLVKPFEIALKSDFSYYLVMPERSRSNPRVEIFCDWLRTECQKAPGTQS